MNNSNQADSTGQVDEILMTPAKIRQELKSGTPRQQLAEAVRKQLVANMAAGKTNATIKFLVDGAGDTELITSGNQPIDHQTLQAWSKGRDVLRYGSEVMRLTSYITQNGPIAWNDINGTVFPQDSLWSLFENEGLIKLLHLCAVHCPRITVAQIRNICLRLRDDPASMKILQKAAERLTCIDDLDRDFLRALPFKDRVQLCQRLNPHRSTEHGDVRNHLDFVLETMFDATDMERFHNDVGRRVFGQFSSIDVLRAARAIGSDNLHERGCSFFVDYVDKRLGDEHIVIGQARHHQYRGEQQYQIGVGSEVFVRHRNDSFMPDQGELVAVDRSDQYTSRIDKWTFRATFIKI